MKVEVGTTPLPWGADNCKRWQQLYVMGGCGNFYVCGAFYNIIKQAI